MDHNASVISDHSLWQSTIPFLLLHSYTWVGLSFLVCVQYLIQASESVDAALFFWHNVDVWWLERNLFLNVINWNQISCYDLCTLFSFWLGYCVRDYCQMPQYKSEYLFLMLLQSSFTPENFIVGDVILFFMKALWWDWFILHNSSMIVFGVCLYPSFLSLPHIFGKTSV